MIKTHSVDVELAKKVGFDEANVLGFVAYWVRNNRDNGKNFYDGKYWTYNSAEALTNQFPYWTRRQISGIIEKLEKIGAIVKGNYNKNKFDRTSWYTLTDDFMYLIASENEKTNTEMDETNTEIHFTNTEMDETNTEIYKDKFKPIAKTKSNTVNLTPLPPKPSLPDFLDPNLWEQYLAYKKERKEKLSKQGIEMKFSEWAKWDAEGIDVNACIREAMANEWQGVFRPKPDKNGGGRNVPNNATTNPHGLSQGTLNTMRAFKQFEAQLIASGQGHRVGGNYDDK
nr:hypothetical protein [uncultured Campylobacter sp.]